MLDIKMILNDPELVVNKLKQRGMDFDPQIILAKDALRKNLTAETEEIKRRRNEISRQVGQLKREGKDTEALQQEVKDSAGRMDAIDNELRDLEKEIRDLLLNIPNLPDDSVPVGRDETENVVYRVWGKPGVYSFEPKAHWDIGTDLDIIDFERATKISGARFAMMKGAGARLERALINFMMDLHAQRGYEELMPPQLITPASMMGTGQLPKFQEEAFWCERDDLYLSPTSEVPVTNMFSGEVLPRESLTAKYTAYSACFRREAGSYGKDTRGLIRLHQFNKVELVMFAEPEKSMAALEIMLEEAEEVLKRLNIPYRVVSLCTGDMGFSSSKTYDIEVWLPGQNAYREISSCSNCKDFQARRANIRYRREDGKTAFLHTLNGSGLAVGRTLVAVLENYQQADGSVVVPEALRSYMGTDIIKKR